MATTKEQITGIKYGGIYYTDQITGEEGAGTLTVSKIVGTTDVGLIGIRINEVTARNVRPEIILLRDKL